MMTFSSVFYVEQGSSKPDKAMHEGYYVFRNRFVREEA